MRKIIAVMLILALLLTAAACGRPAEEAETTTVEPETTQEDQTAEQGTPFFKLSSLPDIGKHSSQLIVDRWYDTYQDHLLLRSDYGTLLPFIGEVADIDASAIYDDTTQLNYGLMTLDGKIVVDAVYNYIWAETAPDGELFYNLETYARTNIPEAQVDHSNPYLESSKRYIIDSKGSKMLEVPYGSYCKFVKDKIVMLPSSEAVGKDPDSIWVFDRDFKQISHLSCKAMTGTNAKESWMENTALDCGYIVLGGDFGCQIFDLNGNRVLKDEKQLSYAWDFYEYIILKYEDETEKLVDASGKNCMPGGKVFSTVSVCGDNYYYNYKKTEYFISVKGDDGYRCYDRFLNPVGPLFDKDPVIVRLFGKMYYRSRGPGEDNLTYYELETGDPLDWSKHTTLDMSRFDSHFDEDYDTPTIVGNRFFLDEYYENTGENRYVRHIDLVDLQSGETVFQKERVDADVYRDRWISFTFYGRYSEDTGYSDPDEQSFIFDTQTQSIVVQEDKIKINEVDGVPYAGWIRNGHSLVKNLETQETLLNMFISSAG
ncbi:MAG: hypothetical protein K5756_09240 [Clostridiales bacterium]|nr:hypothetical protein [Clostridiales bacterium]